MKRFVLFVVMVLMFGFINVNKGECKEIKLNPAILILLVYHLMVIM